MRGSLARSRLGVASHCEGLKQCVKGVNLLGPPVAILTMGPWSMVGPYYGRDAPFKIPLYHLQVDTEVYPEIATKYGVSALPTLMIFKARPTLSQHKAALIEITLFSGKGVLAHVSVVAGSQHQIFLIFEPRQPKCGKNQKKNDQKNGCCEPRAATTVTDQGMLSSKTCTLPSTRMCFFMMRACFCRSKTCT